MVKRKAARKRAAPTTGKVEDPNMMPVPALAIKILSILLAIILVIALTLYVLGRMPARGFWTLAIILAIAAFGVIPWMRRKFTD